MYALHNLCCVRDGIYHKHMRIIITARFEKIKKNCL
jgi:hypothetical protein